MQIMTRIDLMGYLQPSSPSELTIAGVIGYSVDTGAVDALVVEAFVNVDFTQVAFESRQTVARVVSQRIRTAGSVLTFVVVAETALTFHVFQWGSHLELHGRSVVDQICGWEEGQQQSSHAHFIQAAPEGDGGWQDERSESRRS